MSATVVLRVVNRFLKFLGAKIVRTTIDEFHMSAAIQRVKAHGFPINCIIDIGASNGNWTLKAMEHFPEASFLAIEPLREREPALNSLRRGTPNFDYELCVAGGVDRQEITLNISNDLDGSTVNGTGGTPRQVPSKTIDGIVAAKNLQGPYLIKFDTHGYEVPILEGSTKTLGQTSVIIMEAYNFKITDNALRFHEMCAYLENLGFRCYDIADFMLRIHDKSFWQMDLFFCRKDAKIFSCESYK